MTHSKHVTQSRNTSKNSDVFLIIWVPTANLLSGWKHTALIYLRKNMRQMRQCSSTFGVLQFQVTGIQFNIAGFYIPLDAQWVMFGDKSFQATVCTGNDNKKTKKHN